MADHSPHFEPSVDLILPWSHFQWKHCLPLAAQTRNLGNFPDSAPSSSPSTVGTFSKISLCFCLCLPSCPAHTSWPFLTCFITTVFQLFLPLVLALLFPPLYWKSEWFLFFFSLFFLESGGSGGGAVSGESLEGKRES